MYADEFLEVLIENRVGAALRAVHASGSTVVDEAVTSVSLRRSSVVLHTASYERHPGGGGAGLSIDDLLNLLDPESAARLTVRVVYIAEGTMGIEPVVAVTAATGDVVALAQSGAVALRSGRPPVAATATAVRDVC